MAKFQEYFLELLKKDELWKALTTAFSRHISDDWDELPAPQRILDGRGIYTHDEKYTEDELADELLEVFQKHVIDKIGQLAPITAVDLTSIAISQLTGIPFWRADSDERDTAIRRFLAFSQSEIQTDRECPRCFDLGTWRTEIDEFDKLELVRFPTGAYGSTMWSSSTGLSLIIELQTWPELPVFHEAKGFLYGRCSERALPIAEAQFGTLLQSIVRTLNLSQPEQIDEFRYNGPALFLISGDGKRILRTSLAAYFRDENSQVDTLLERLRNATVLLHHADQLLLDPLSLALSFSAIEALVCEKDRNVQQIKEHVPTLLCRLADPGDDAGELRPSTTDRVEKLENLKRIRKKKGNVLSRLYDIRSDVMHGRKVQASREASELVRRVAAGVVRAAVCWRSNQEMAGAESSWEELICELDAARPGRSNQEVVGVPDLSELIPDKVPS